MANEAHIIREKRKIKMNLTNNENSPTNKHRKSTNPDETELIQYLTPYTCYKITCISSILEPFVFILKNIANYDFLSMNGYIPIRMRSTYPELTCLTLHPKRSCRQLLNINARVTNESISHTTTFPIFENVTFYNNQIQLLVSDSTYELINQFVNNMDCMVIHTKKRH